jgi:hypothetical protein
MLAALPAKGALCKRRLELLETAMRAFNSNLVSVLWSLAGHVSVYFSANMNRDDQTNRILATRVYSRLLELRRAEDLRLLHGNTVRGHFGLTDERGAFLDDEAGCLEVTNQLRAALELTTLFHRDIPVHLAVNGDGFGLDLTANLGVLTDDQNAWGENFAFDLAVDGQVILELDRPFDLDV